MAGRGRAATLPAWMTAGADLPFSHLLPTRYRGQYWGRMLVVMASRMLQ